MPPRPFPFGLGVGTDIVHVPRIHQLVSKPLSANTHFETNLERFMRRFLTYREQRLFWERFNDPKHALGPWMSEAVRHLAGRWAAKEAAIKAMRSRRLNFMDIQILRHRLVDGRSGVYALILDRPASPIPPIEQVAKRTDDETACDDPEDPPGQIAKISISHDGEYATAVCLAVEGTFDGDVGGEAAARSP